MMQMFAEVNSTNYEIEVEFTFSIRGVMLLGSNNFDTIDSFNYLGYLLLFLLSFGIVVSFYSCINKNTINFIL